MFSDSLDEFDNAREVVTQLEEEYDGINNNNNYHLHNNKFLFKIACERADYVTYGQNK